MKRDPALTSLSHDHHQALFRAMKLKRATAEDEAEVTASALEYWRDDGARHFRLEEEILFPAYAAVADPAQENVARALTDHAWIRSRMHLLASGELGLDGMHELGRRLDDHVRHEERVLFPQIEDALSAEERAAVGERLAAAEDL